MGTRDGWDVSDEALTKTYEFDDFRAAIDFMSRASERIDELDHHPEWTNVYNRVEVRLQSHDVGRVTERDERLAEVLDACASGRTVEPELDTFGHDPADVRRWGVENGLLDDESAPLDQETFTAYHEAALGPR
ncbi:hypothetical protein EHW97_12060 [Aeromicrobium camelliae]|uniref:Putative pterin-4-alpha-carbinolamine dehydratase n=1 Tax=Aeromicrobium camelliae TaxID=1538144 RepID=A0A3N6W5F3_9ACTN|nr:4a-hydroxytetrahydrobiopterin dehydratase [Aeromicrobium camelliae]RQN02766.1 hypothetical protein EHW97_12060 [Aeromicrobium camelliae]